MDPFPTSSHLFDDIRRRLHNSILFYNGVPVACRHVEGEIVQLFELRSFYDRAGTTPLATIAYTDPKLDDSIPTLGYVNVPGRRAMLASRTTARVQRSGLPYECVLMDGVYGYDTYVFTINFRDMLLNKYPSMQEACDTAKTDGLVAFSKSYAIDARKNIFHRSRIIGHLVPSSGYSSGYELKFHSGVTRAQFYRRNFVDRFKNQMHGLIDDRKA